MKKEIEFRYFRSTHNFNSICTVGLGSVFHVTCAFSSVIFFGKGMSGYDFSTAKAREIAEIVAMQEEVLPFKIQFEQSASCYATNVILKTNISHVIA